MAVAMLITLIIVTMVLPYQLTVVLRCTKVVKKGGQHYIVPGADNYGHTHGHAPSSADNVSETVTIESQQ